MMRFLSVCSGIEAASVAWEKLGWKAVGFSEIEPFPCELLKQRFPNVPNYGDLTNYEQWPLAAGDVDILIGGPPCQAFSVAGLREGMADPRGNLSLVYFGLVQRLRPKWIVYENVPGLLSSRSGSDFSSLLTALAECGYGFAYRVLDASHFGLAQRRKRIFLVGCRTGDWRHPTAVLFDGPSSFGHPPKGEEKGKATASPAGASVGGASRINCRPDGISGTVTNKWHKGSGGPAGDEHYNLVVGSSEAFPVSDDRAAFNQGENALYDPFIGHTNTCPTLVAKGPHAVQPPIAFKVRCGGEYTGEKGGEVRPNERGGTGMLHYEDKTFTVAATQDQFVATPSQQLLYENHPQDSRVTGPHDIAPTVAAKFGTGGGNVPLVQGADPVTWQPGNLRLDAGADPSTVATTTLKASMGDQMPHIATPMAVRRLLPSECEALQGFPKDWTKISWRGKSPDECPDGPRYKAIGNSMAVNCMHWIGRRIQLVEDIISETK
jgi:DNA (cytosine-5)-methyltransferase 1